MRICLINTLTSAALFLVVVLYIAKCKIPFTVLLIAIALGIYGTWYSIYYPFEGRCNTKETFINNKAFENIDFENNFEIKDSKINGLGLISKMNIPENTILFKCIKNKKILPSARKINHCQFEKSNTILVKNSLDNDWYLKTIKDIKIGDEITSDYNIVPENLVKRANPEWKC
jgi:hypothetical protein